MADAPSAAARSVTTPEDVQALVDAILDPARATPIVGVTAKPSAEQPFIDADALAARLAGKADVWVLTDSDLTWTLTDALPQKLDVYGGAARVWNTLDADDEEPYPSDHPQWTMFNEDEGEKAAGLIAEYIELTGPNPLPAFGDRTKATVTKVFRAGAELLLETGHPGFVSMSHLVQHGEVFHTADVLQEHQEIPVRVGAWNTQAGRLSVSLREFAPDPWERLAEVYQEGDIIEGGVTGVTAFGAFVELLPGVEGLLHKSKIADEFVEYVDDYVREGDRITVELLSLDPRDRKAAVSLRGLPRNPKPIPPASIFPGGPPWLPDPNAAPAAEPSGEQAPEPAAAREPLDTRTEAERDADRREAEEERRDAQARAAALPRVGSSVPEPEAPYTPQLLALVGLIADHGVDGSELAAPLRDALERAIVTFDAQLDEADDATEAEPDTPLAAVRDAARDLIEALRTAETDAGDEDVTVVADEIAAPDEVSDELPADGISDAELTAELTAEISADDDAEPSAPAANVPAPEPDTTPVDDGQLDLTAELSSDGPSQPGTDGAADEARTEGA
ncbi:MAG: S1 RNA-binding domain-containing protein [Patulibacter minatonensis]